LTYCAGTAAATASIRGRYVAYAAIVTLPNSPKTTNINGSASAAAARSTI
jgi:hypothetical protein